MCKKTKTKIPIITENRISNYIFENLVFMKKIQMSNHNKVCLMDNKKDGNLPVLETQVNLKLFYIFKPDK